MGANEVSAHGDRDTDSRAQIGRLLHWLSRRHFQYCEERLQEVGIGPGQVPILMELSRCGELSQRVLAEKVHVTPATISGTLKRLERGGIISRREDEKDARVSLVSLSERGRALSEEARHIFREADCMIIEKFNEQECDELLSYLRRMLDIVQEGLAKAAFREGDKE